MKLYNKFRCYSWILILMVSMASCNKNVTLDPINFQPTTYTSAAQIYSQLAACYANLSVDNSAGFGLYSHAIWGYMSAGADETFRTDAATGTTSQVLTESYRGTSDEVTYSNFWRACYKGIEQANIIISVINQPNVTEAERKNILGQAVFMRAYYLYLLTSNFGDVVLKTTLTSDMSNFNIPATPTAEVYNFIIDEMKKADTLVNTMPKVTNTSMVTQTAVEAVLARVCLSMAGQPVKDQSKYAEALFWAEKVINSGVHDLNVIPLSVLTSLPATVGVPAYNAYANVFVNNMQNNVSWYSGNREGIWDATFLSKSNLSGAYANTNYPVTQQLGSLMGITNNATANPFGALNISNFGFSGGTYRVFPKLYNLYEAGDARRDWAIAPFVYNATVNGKAPVLSVIISGGGGTGATAIAKVNASKIIESIVVENGGSGYTSAPTVSFVATAGSGATATAEIGADGKVTAIKLTRGGSGYPTIYDRPVGKWRREFETNLSGVTRINQNTSCNFPIIRYADVLLMAAEADLMVNSGSPSAKGLAYYNRVRRRAFGVSISTPNAAVDVTTFTLQDIINERSRELCFEGLRRLDLKRWGVMQQTMQALLADNNLNAPSGTQQDAATITARNFLSNPTKFIMFPIPSSELQIDAALVQNPGW